MSKPKAHIKGKGNQSGTTRLEWETEINVIEAKALLALCEPGSIQKTRYLVPFKNQTFLFPGITGRTL